MKKLLAIFLALIMILSVALVACNKKTETTSSNNDDDSDDDFVVQTKDTESDTDDDNDDDDDDDKATGTWLTTDIPSKVYTFDDVNIRSEMSMSSSAVIKTLDIGTELQVVAAYSKIDEYDVPLWYKVNYEGAERYVSGAWVTANKDDTVFSECTPEILVIKNSGNSSSPHNVNLRTDPALAESTLTNIVLSHVEATSAGELKKVGSNTSGSWFIVEYDSDKNGTPERYYIKMSAEVRGCFGLPTNSGSSGNG